MATTNPTALSERAGENPFHDIAVDHPVKQGFTVCDEASANWVARKIVEARAHTKRTKAWAEQEVRRAEREEQFFLWHFGYELQQWATRQIKVAGGKRKSVSLPAGTIGFRQQKAKLLVEDDTRLLAWAKAHCPAAVKVQESVSKTELNEHVEATGELPDGVRLEPEHEAFYVK